MKYTLEEIGKTIKELRNSKNWSQIKLGEKLGITGKQVSNYESGALCPPVDILFKLCEIFNCELGFLLGEDDYSSGTKLTTAIEKELGLNTDSINNLKHITGSEKSCISFGYESSHYRKLLNNLLSSPDFILFIESIYYLDSSVENKEKIWSELEEKYESNILNQAYEYYQSTTDYYHVEESERLPNIYYQAMSDIDNTIDKDRDRSYTIKVLRYEAKEAFERLLYSLYPFKK